MPSPPNISGGQVGSDVGQEAMRHNGIWPGPDTDPPSVASRQYTPSKVLFPKGSSGHRDMRSLFPAAAARTPLDLFYWVMEDDIALQAAEESARVECVQVLRVKYAAAAQLKSPPEKEVSWSSQEVAGWSEASDEEMEGTLPTPHNTSTRSKRGSSFCKASKQERLTAQLHKQELLASAASALASSLRDMEKTLRQIHTLHQLHSSWQLRWRSHRRKSCGKLRIRSRAASPLTSRLSAGLTGMREFRAGIIFPVHSGFGLGTVVVTHNPHT